MMGSAAFTKAVGWVRAEYPREPPGGHIALLALCCKRPVEPSRR